MAIRYSIDPGVGGTGVARWNGLNLIKAFTLHSKEESWLYSAEAIALQLREEFEFNRPSGIDRFFVESPVYFGGKNRVVAESGDLCKLAMLAGMILHECMRFSRMVELVTPGEWKGNLPKSVCAARIRRTMGREFPNYRLSNHAVDAIGIGLWSLGRFK